MDNGWQPISTAPKDGTPILIWEPGPHAFGNRERHNEYDERGKVISFAEYDDVRWAIGYWRPTGSWGNRNAARVNPTHWMPLPAPPVTP